MEQDVHSHPFVQSITGVLVSDQARQRNKGHASYLQKHDLYVQNHKDSSKNVLELMYLMKFQYMKSGKNQFHYIHNEVAEREIKKLYIQYI